MQVCTSSPHSSFPMKSSTRYSSSVPGRSASTWEWPWPLPTTPTSPWWDPCWRSPCNSGSLPTTPTLSCSCRRYLYAHHLLLHIKKYWIEIWLEQMECIFASKASTSIFVHAMRTLHADISTFSRHLSSCGISLPRGSICYTPRCHIP